MSIPFTALTALGETNHAQMIASNPPNKPPAIFAASMPPCIIGIAHQYGDELGISDKTKATTEALIDEANEEVPAIIDRVRELELKLMQASKEERYADYETYLRELSEVKVKASLFHEELVKKARKSYDADDINKLDHFISENKEVFLKQSKL